MFHNLNLIKKNSIKKRVNFNQNISTYRYKYIENFFKNSLLYRYIKSLLHL